MKKKERGQEQNKNPLHRVYGVFRNTAFTLRNMIACDKRFLLLIPIGIVCSAITSYLWTFLSKFILDMVTGEGSREQLFRLMLLFAAVQTTATVLQTYFSNDISWRYIRARTKMIIRVNTKAMRVDFEHLENPDVMDCFQKAKNACGNNNAGVEGMMRQLTDLLISLAIVLVGMLILGTMNVFVVVLMLVVAFVNFLLVNHANATAKKKVWDPLATWWRKRYYLENTTTNFKEAKDIRMFGLRDWLLEKYRDLNKIRCDAQKENSWIWFWTSFFTNLCWVISQIMIYMWLIYLVAKGRLSIGNFSLYLASAGTFFNHISGLLNGVNGLLARSRELDDYRSFLDFDGGDGNEKGKAVPAFSTYEFTFENVSFSYPKAERYALKNLNLTLKAGERLAVVGLNGAGKSTMIKLLLRLYEPTEGRILLNGVDVREYDKQSYYEVFAPVFQQVELFAFPMEENVSMKEPSETDSEKAGKCLAAAGLSEKIETLPNGTKTELLKVVYDDGVDLSGGEKQKLALARALYKEAPVVILDEPTAALDALAEARLYEDFDRLIGGKTAVYISHRLSSTQFCNRIAMFAGGELVEYGTHSELLEKGGAYAEMFRIQAQYYVDGEEKEAEVYGES